MKHLLKIYDIFKPNNNIDEVESLNYITKATKKILINKKKYRNYFAEYTKKTEVYSFKSPGITQYPLLQKKSCSLLPIHRKKMNFYEDLKENKKETEKKDELSLFSKNSKFLMNTSRESFYKNKMRENIQISKILFKNKLLNLEKSKHLVKNKPRYNSLFLDFFHKWNKDKNENYISLNDEDSKINSNNKYVNNTFANHIDDYKHIINEKFSELKYDDNLIFNTNYTPFVNERIDFILLNNIENIETKLESNFDDFNKYEIKLRLESIKIIFKLIKSKISTLNKKSSKEIDSQNNIVLYIPLYFAFIFCLKDVDFFKYILLSCITFSENEEIIFDETLIKPALKAMFKQMKEEKEESKKKARSSDVFNIMNKKNTSNIRRTGSKAGLNLRKSIEKKGATIINDNSNVLNMARNSILDFSLDSKKKKKEEIVYSNKKKNSYFHNLINNKDSNKIDDEVNKINSRKEINQYNEYVFTWETKDKTYLVNLQMPIIYFDYKNLKEEIQTFCDKSLFLFMYKNNFINWDFYSLNYLFSLKIFRKKILQNYSLVRKSILPKKDLEQPSDKSNIFNITNKKAETVNSNSTFNINKLNINNNGEIPIINRDKTKIYNMINSNNESYIYFYTNELYQNSLIKLYSYLILIDYDKLNPKIRWKYILDFKQMKQLNEISKYEPLETFLPKIIQTDFQNGRLSIDFSLFNEFNINILGYEKKNLSKVINEINPRNKVQGVLSSYTKENEDLCIDIKFPSLKQETIFKDVRGKILIKKTNLDLDINFLQDLNNFKMDFWSRKILAEINKKSNPSKFSTKDIAFNFSDKKNNIKKTNTNNAGHYNPFSINKPNKNFIKSTTQNFSSFGNKYN